jgi:hypothetical protein
MISCEGFGSGSSAGSFVREAWRCSETSDGCYAGNSPYTSPTSPASHSSACSGACPAATPTYSSSSSCSPLLLMLSKTSDVRSRRPSSAMGALFSGDDGGGHTPSPNTPPVNAVAFAGVSSTVRPRPVSLVERYGGKQLAHSCLSRVCCSTVTSRSLSLPQECACKILILSRLPHELLGSRALDLDGVQCRSHIHIRTHIRTHTHTHTHKYVCSHPYLYTCILTYTRTH